MKSKNKILILIASIIGIMIASICTQSMAYLPDTLTDKEVKKYGELLETIKANGSNSIGTRLEVSHARMLKIRNDLYCINHKAGFLLSEYHVKNYMTIKGNTATMIDKETSKSKTSEGNGELAYILAQKQGFTYTHDKNLLPNYDANNTPDYSKYYSTAQKALYIKQDDWYNEVGRKIDFDTSYDWTTDEYKDLLLGYATTDNEVKDMLNNAKDYASNLGTTNENNEITVTDKTDKDNISVNICTDNNTKYLRIGPFMWMYGGGNITEVNVYEKDNIKISNEYIKYSYFEGNTEKFYNSSKEITSNKDFYICIDMNSEATEINKIEVKVEPKIDTQYNVEIWLLESTDYQNLLLVKPEEKEISPVNISFEYDIPLTKNLTIEKVDSRNNSIKLKGVGFIIQNKETGKYVRKQNGQITYDSARENATEFVTDANGEIKIDKLIKGTYLAYETVNPNYGYKKIDGSIEIVESENKKVIPNEQIYVKLSGYVWKDIQSTKKTIRNDLYRTNYSYDLDEYEDNQDIAFNGIVVRLKDQSGNIIKETTTGEKGLYSEINGGEYTFNDVLIEQLANYYVEFEYDGLIYQSVVAHLDRNSGSKATDKVERDILDKNFASVNSTGENRVNVNDKYSITYNNTTEHATSIKDSSDCTLHANTKDTGYGINFNPGTTEIRYINLGLYEKPQADLSLTQDLETVNVGVNGYWHVYKYGSRTYDDSGYNVNDATTWNVGVKFKNSYTGTYKRALYQADIDYTSEDKNKELQVYLTYKIAITNESSYLTKANSIIDYFDNRYTVVAVGTGLDGQNNITGNISYQTPQKYNDKYQKCIINVNTTVKSGESNYIYVQFKLDRSAVLQIMNNGETLSNRAEINSYTVYKDNNGNTVAAVDRDSVPGNTKIENVETYEDDTDAAPSVQLEIADARKIEGTVFVDSTTGELKTGEIRQGNGMFDEGETTVSGVTVTLHEINNSIPNIVTTTDEKGNFELSNYIPGQYTITYTWGDKTYTVQNYKGTVYDSSRNQGDMYWHKDQVDTRRTDAIDNYQTRLAIDNEMAAITNNTINAQIEDAYNGGNNHPDITITKMDSTTPTMEFGVEYETAVTDGTIDKVEFIVKNVDFGIVERARQQLDMTKRVSTFKITLANGQVLVDATVDENGNLGGVHNYVTYMGPSINNGYSNNGFIKAEMDNELIEGATLEVGYEIKFINNSETDYMSENYYKYGIKEGNIVTLTPSAVVDYLDKDLGFEQDKNTDWKQITVDDLTNLHAVRAGDTEFLNSRIILYTDKTAKQLKPTETVGVNLNVSKLLTTSSDLAFNNDAETVKVNKTENAEHKGSAIRYFPSDDAEEVEITPSTGDDRNYVLPVVVGMITLVVLGVGVFAIKKFVIK